MIDGYPPKKPFPNRVLRQRLTLPGPGVLCQRCLNNRAQSTQPS